MARTDIERVMAIGIPISSAVPNPIANAMEPAETVQVTGGRLRMHYRSVLQEDLARKLQFL
jgi:hypothetical protein